MGILVVGSVALDSVKTPFGEVTAALGGSATHFAAAASFFTKVHMVGVVGEDFPMGDLDFLKKRQVDLSGIQIKKGKTFRWRGRYGFDLNVAETLETHLNVFSDFSPEIPPAFQNMDLVFLGNIHPKLQKQVLRQVKKPKLTALDTMNFWIGGELGALKDVISEVDLVIINEGEARELSQEASLVKAAKKIRSWGPKILIIKRGEYGALLFLKDETFSAPGLPLESVKDPTGAGDSFAGGFMGYLASQGEVTMTSLRQAVIIGSVMASFNVEDFSCNRLRNLTSVEIKQRAAEFKKLSHFEEIKIDRYYLGGDTALPLKPPSGLRG